MSNFTGLLTIRILTIIALDLLLKHLSFKARSQTVTALQSYTSERGQNYSTRSSLVTQLIPPRAIWRSCWFELFLYSVIALAMMNLLYHEYFTEYSYTPRYSKDGIEADVVCKRQTISTPELLATRVQLPKCIDVHLIAHFSLSRRHSTYAWASKTRPGISSSWSD
jgi:hypothetical protein